jgi:hypothetical protein
VRGPLDVAFVPVIRCQCGRSPLCSRQNIPFNTRRPATRATPPARSAAVAKSLTAQNPSDQTSHFNLRDLGVIFPPIRESLIWVHDPGLEPIRFLSPITTMGHDIQLRQVR